MAATESRRRKRILKPGSNAFVFLVCTVLAGTFWLIKAMQDEYITKVEFPITYQSFPKNKILKDSLPEKAELKLQSEGWELLKLQLSKRPFPLVVDLSDPSIEHQIQLTENSFFRKDKVPEGLKILSISPDTLSIRFGQAVEKQLPVKLNGNFSYAANHNLADSIQVVPAEILVSGPKSYLAEMDYVETVEFDYKNIKEKRIEKTALRKPSKPFVSYRKNAVRIIIPAETLTEKTLKVPVECRNPYYQNRLTIIPKKVKVSFQTPLSRYKAIKSDDFQIKVSGRLADQAQKPDKLPVALTKKPDFIYNLRPNPRKVDYLISSDPSLKPN